MPNLSSIHHALKDIDTPALLVDKARLQANIQRYAEIAATSNVRLRPHIKTHKTPEIATMQLRAGAGGITTAKLSEAEVFIKAGIRDIFVAYPVVGRDKAHRAAQLARHCRLLLGADSIEGVQQLSQAAEEAGVTIRIRVEIETGMQRTGVAPHAAETLCRQIQHLPGLELDGIFTFRSIWFPGATTNDITELGRQEGELMVTLAQNLRQAGIPIQEISVGSTPTTPSVAQVPGITEVRPGTYVFFDRMMTHAGVNAPHEIALSVLATVVSRPTDDIAVIDAGSKTFCGDIVPANAGLEGYGVTTDGQNGVVIRMSEEHGVVRLAPGFSPAIGDKLAFYPNHVCTTVNLSEELVVVQEGLVRDIWRIAARGMRQ